jgi:tRNA A-37 threonylcarbamoyl transferase component Bud32
MTETKTCPQCHAALPVGAPEGLCRACLLRMGLESNTVGTVETEAPARWVPPEPAALAVRFPDLELLELLGRGGMGAVYKARQTRLDRLVALKILPPEISQDRDFTERFAREAQAMARLNHPHIVTIHDFGQTNGLYFFVMEYVDGLNLRQVLDAERMASREALAIVPQICDALQYAHDQGIVHRDIKPENILLNRQGQVKIADFGLAKLVGADGPTRGTERVMGTPQYMAPEQVQRPDEVDHRADIYSLGVVFYQMLTGEFPAKLAEPPSKKVAIDVRLDEVVLRALEKDPERRYQQVSEVKTQMETIASTPPVSRDRPLISLKAPLKTSHGMWTTPERLATPGGSFVWFRSTGELALYDDQLVLAEGWQRTEIPFAAVQELGFAREPRWESPLGHQFLSVSYVQKDERKTLLFMSGGLWFRTAGDTRQRAAEWITAIRDTAKAAMGNDLCCRMDQVTVIPTFPWGLLLSLLPLLSGAIVLGSLLLYRPIGPQSSTRTVPAHAVERMRVPTKEPWHFELLEERKPGPSPEKK